MPTHINLLSQFTDLSLRCPEDALSSSPSYAAVAFWLAAKLNEIGVPSVELDDATNDESDGEGVSARGMASNVSMSVDELYVFVLKLKCALSHARDKTFTHMHSSAVRLFLIFFHHHYHSPPPHAHTPDGTIHHLQGILDHGSTTAVRTYGCRRHSPTYERACPVCRPFVRVVQIRSEWDLKRPLLRGRKTLS